MQRKKKRSTSESPSPNSVSSRTCHQLSKNARNSPLSQVYVGKDGLGCSAQNPVDVQEEVVGDSAVAPEKGTNKVLRKCFHVLLINLGKKSYLIFLWIVLGRRKY